MRLLVNRFRKYRRQLGSTVASSVIHVRLLYDVIDV